MTKLLVVVGSARKGRVADKIVNYVKQDLDARQDVEVTVADLGEINLPFFDNEVIPAAPDYTPNSEAGKQWQSLVNDADRVLLISPEYNHSYAPILKNALDYLVTEWDGKPVGSVAYGWAGGERAIAALQPVFDNLKIDRRGAANLSFTHQIQPSGDIIDEKLVATEIKTIVDELLA